MAYGVTPEGFQRMRLPEIREMIVAQARANLRAQNLPDTIKTRPDSVTGVIIDTFAERETALWEMAEGIYYAMYPGSAVGAQLDRAVSFSGVVRLLAEKSQAYVVLYGLPNTVVPAGSQIRHRVTQNLWATSVDTTISAGAAADVSISPNVMNNATYTVTVDGAAYSFTADNSATLAEVLAGLVATLSNSTMQASSNGAVLRLLSTTQLATNVVLSTNLSFTRIGASVLAETLTAVAEEAAPGDLNTIVTLVSGWTDVSNLVAGSVGRMEETDAQLRLRYGQGVFRLGAGTLPSIEPNLRANVPGLIDVRAFQNDTDVVDSAGRKPHSIHVIVDGGIEETIAQVIYKYKGGGIDTNGDILRILSTTEGLQEIYFDRPDPIYVWVRAALTLLPASEQAFPSNGFELVQKAIADLGALQVIGQDVILQKFFCAIYTIPGIAEVDLKFATSSNPAFVPGAGDFTASNITVADVQKAIFDITRVQVT